MKKRTILPIVCALPAMLPLLAASDTDRVMTVRLKEGKPVCFKIDDIDKVTFDTMEEPDLTDADILSSAETANCYIARPGSKVAFSTSVKGNSEESTGNVAGVRLVWQDSRNLMKSLQYASTEKMAVASLGDQPGNALVAAIDADGKTLWSWHIWVTDFDPDASAYTTPANEYGTTWTFMDRNLGALSASPDDGFATHGLIYQWGRKDPFPAPTGETLLDENYNYIDGMDGETMLYDMDGNALPKINGLAEAHGSLQKSIENPMTFYYMTYEHTGELDEYGQEIVLNDPRTGDWTDMSNDDFWGGVSGKKSMYDPCPPGWKVPVSDAGGNTPYAWLIYADMTWDNESLGASQNGQWFPACGTRVYASGGCDYQLANPYGGIWFGTKGKESSNLAEYPDLYGQYMMIVNGKRTFKVSKDKRSQGMSVRAVRDNRDNNKD